MIIYNIYYINIVNLHKNLIFIEQKKTGNFPGLIR